MLDEFLKSQSSKDRRIIEKRLSAVRKADLRQLCYQNGGGVGSYDLNLKMDIHCYIRKLINEHIEVEILDVGMGQGVFLTGLKMLFGPYVKTTGVALQEVDPRKFGHYLPRTVDEEIFEPIEVLEFEPRFHAVFSVRSYEYFFDKARALENITNGLRVGGIAHIHNREGFYDEGKIIDYLAKNGFDVDSDYYNIGEPVIRINRKNPSKIELQKFYKYASEI